MEVEVDGGDISTLSGVTFPIPLAPHLQREASQLYDLLLVSGVSPGDSYQKVFEIFSPPRVTAAMAEMPGLTLVGGDSFDLRVDGVLSRARVEGVVHLESDVERDADALDRAALFRLAAVGVEAVRGRHCRANALPA